MKKYEHLHLIPFKRFTTVKHTYVSVLRNSMEMIDGDHCTHGDNSQHGVGPSVPQQDVYEGDDLQGFPQPHAVSQDTAKTTATLVPLQGLHKVIVQKADSSNLTDNGDMIRWINT